jgi:hypothetical protein
LKLQRSCQAGSSIDATVLRKAGKLEAGSCAVWSWSRGSGLVGAVNLVASANSIEICGYVTAAARAEQVRRRSLVPYSPQASRHWR